MATWLELEQENVAMKAALRKIESAAVALQNVEGIDTMRYLLQRDVQAVARRAIHPNAQHPND